MRAGVYYPLTYCHSSHFLTFKEKHLFTGEQRNGPNIEKNVTFSTYNNIWLVFIEHFWHKLIHTHMKSVIINFVSFCEKLKQSPSTRVLNEFLTQEKQFFQCCSHITQAHFIQCHVLSSLCEFCFSTVVLWSPVSKLTQRVHLYSRSSPMLLYISSIIG